MAKNKDRDEKGLFQKVNNIAEKYTEEFVNIMLEDLGMN